jgi:hypothetical protein
MEASMGRKFTLEFDCDNAAFCDGDEAHESSRLLEDIAAMVSQGRNNAAIYDINGNRIGKWSFEGERLDEEEEEEEDEDSTEDEDEDA